MLCRIVFAVVRLQKRGANLLVLRTSMAVIGLGGLQMRSEQRGGCFCFSRLAVLCISREWQGGCLHCSHTHTTHTYIHTQHTHKHTHTHTYTHIHTHTHTSHTQHTTQTNTHTSISHTHTRSLQLQTTTPAPQQPRLPSLHTKITTTST